MKRGKVTALGLMLAVTVITMTSCEFIQKLFNEPPTVSLSFADGADADLYSLQSVGIIATMTDPDDDPLDWTWSLAGVAQTDVTDSEITYTAPNAATDTTKVLSISVTDGEETATASITLNITASATLLIENNSSTALDYLYLVPDPQGIDGNWGTDWLGSDTVAPDESLRIVGISAGSKNIKWEYHGGYYIWYLIPQVFTNGAVRTLTLTYSSYTDALVNQVTGPHGSITGSSDGNKSGPRQLIYPSGD